MRTIKIEAIPNQEFSFMMNNQRYVVTFNSRNDKTYLSYSIENNAVLLNRICLDRAPIDDLFMFEDIEGLDNHILYWI